jgi:hypothetical protein
MFASMRLLRLSLLISFLAAASSAYAADMRTMRYQKSSPEETQKWQADLRAKLFKLLKLDDLVPQVDKIPFDAKETKSWETPEYTGKEFTIQSTPTRKITILVTQPKAGKGPFPAVVCIGGHGSRMVTPYTNGKDFGPYKNEKDAGRIYKGFGAELAKTGYVTISTLVSQHEVYEKGRSLMGERLWDLMRCVSYVESLPEVDKSHIGCGGLSLGGEMTMWLAAMDTRIACADSDGFLTTMDQMEKGHCMCWKFDGLRELVDYADIYALIAPRPLECQNGRKEPAGSFTPELAKKALSELKPAYAAFGKEDNATLDIHDGEHEVDLPAILAFFKKNLKP